MSQSNQPDQTIRTNQTSQSDQPVQTVPDSPEPMEPSELTNIPMLDAAEAARMLDSIFEESGVEPNSIPMEALTAYSDYRRERYLLQRIIIVIAMVLFLLLPFLFIAPDYTVSLQRNGERDLPVYTIEVGSFLPVSQVTATLEGHSLPVYPEEDRAYTIEPTRNGDMIVSVTFVNRQKTSKIIHVQDVDEQGPEILSASTDREYVYITVQDKGIGVDYEGVYARTDSGEILRPDSYNEVTGEIILRYPSEPCDLYVPDHIGNTLHLRLSFQ